MGRLGKLPIVNSCRTSAQNQSYSPYGGWDSTQPGRGAHSGSQGATWGSHALCPSSAGMNPMPSFSAFALAFCRAVVSSSSAICRS